MVINAMNRERLIAQAVKLPLPGCPAINGGSQWAQWLPGLFLAALGFALLISSGIATLFEFILFGFIFYKAVVGARVRVNGRSTLAAVLIHENIAYFSM